MSPLLHDRTEAPTEPTTEVVEARTAEEAVAEVHRLHGEGARIVAADKVLRGGIRGFFARELVQLTVELAPAAVPTADDERAVAATTGEQADPSVPTGTGAGDDEAGNLLLSALASGVDDGPPGETFGELLDRRASGRSPLTTSVPRAGARAAGAPDGARRAVVTGDSSDEGIARTLASLAQATEDQERTFGAALREAFGEDAGSSTVRVLGAQPATEASGGLDAAATSGTPTPIGRPDQLPDPTTTSSADDPAGGHDGAPRGVARLVEDPPMSGGATQLVAGQAGASSAGARRLARATRGLSVHEDATTDPVRPTPIDPPPVAIAPTDSAPVHDPLPGRHEAFRQLRRQLGEATAPSRPAVVPGASAGDPQEPRLVSVVDASVRPGWSADALARAGVPDSLVATIAAADPDTDLDWLTTTTRALEPLCGPLPTGEVVVGPDAAAVAPCVGAVRLRPGRPVSAGAAVALSGPRDSDARRWLAEEGRGRPLHLVVGGSGWRQWLFDRPAIVSWTSDDDLPDALDAADRFELTLGWRVDGDVAVRATAVDVAIAIRARVVGR